MHCLRCSFAVQHDAPQIDQTLLGIDVKTVGFQEHFREDVPKEDWKLVVKIKKLLNIA